MAWADSVLTVGKWFEANIHNYNQGQYSHCSLPLCGNVRHDCSGYTSACLRHAGIIGTNLIFRSGDFLPSGSCATYLLRAGFVCMPYNINNVQPFDIIARNGHVEIYAGKIGNSMRSWSWGSCHDGMNGHAGMPAYMSKQSYTVIWRKGGAGPGIATPWNPDNTLIENNATWPGVMGIGTLTFTSSPDDAVFTSALNNSFTPTTDKLAATDTSLGHRTRIYSALNPTILVDEFSLAMDERRVSTDNSVADGSDARNGNPDASTNA